MIEIMYTVRNQFDPHLHLYQTLMLKALHTAILTSTETSDEKNRCARRVVLGVKKAFDESRTLLMHKAAAFDITPETVVNAGIISHHYGSPVASSAAQTSLLCCCVYVSAAMVRVTVFVIP